MCAGYELSAWRRRRSELSRLLLDLSMALFYSGTGGWHPPRSVLCPSPLLADDIERDKEPARGGKGTPAEITLLSHHRRDLSARPAHVRRSSTCPRESTREDADVCAGTAQTALCARRESPVERALWRDVINTCAGVDTCFSGSMREVYTLQYHTAVLHRHPR